MPVFACISRRRAITVSAEPCSRVEARSSYLMGLPFSETEDRKNTRLNSRHQIISYAVFCLKKKILVEPQRAGHGARDLGRLERVGQPRAVVVALGRDEYLRLVLEPPERLAVHDPVAVALERRAQPAVDLRPRALGGVGAGSRRGERRVLRGAHARFEP